MKDVQTNCLTSLIVAVGKKQLPRYKNEHRRKRKYFAIIQCKTNKTKPSAWKTETKYNKQLNTVEEGLFWNHVNWNWRYVQVLIICTFLWLFFTRKSPLSNCMALWFVNREMFKESNVVHAAQRLFWVLTYDPVIKGSCGFMCGDSISQANALSNLVAMSFAEMDMWHVAIVINDLFS